MIYRPRKNHRSAVLLFPLFLGVALDALALPPGESVVFATFSRPLEDEVETMIWARSIRDHGGSLAGRPIWVFAPNAVESLSGMTRSELAKLGVDLIPVPVNSRALSFPLAAKVFAAAAAESRASGRWDLLAWMDPDSIIIAEPREFLLPRDKTLGYRPVHHLAIGSPYDKPPDRFWSRVFSDCRVPESRIFPVTTVADAVRIRPYFNAGHLVVRPGKGLLNRWRENFEKMYSMSSYQEFYRQDTRYAVFVHQAILTGTILSRVERTHLVEFSERYNYPLNLYREIPRPRRVRMLGDLATVRYDDVDSDLKWLAMIGIREPLQGWLRRQFSLKGIAALLLMSCNYGANYFLNRDVFELMGWNVALAGVEDSIPACRFIRDPLGAPALRPDVLLPEIDNLARFEAFAVMPASSSHQTDPYREVLDNPEAMQRILDAVRLKIPVSTICSGARLLAAAGVIRGMQIIGQPAFKEEYEKAGAVLEEKDHPPIIQGSIVTGARDQYYNYANTQALARMVEMRGMRGTHTPPPAAGFILDRPGSFAADGLLWARTIGGFGPDGGRSVAATADGGYLVTGYTFSHGTGDSDVLVVKTDPLGKAIWSKSFGGAGTEYGFSGIQLKDGYLVTGYTTSFGAGSRDVYAAKLDPGGKEIWSRTYGGAGWDVGMAAAEAGDGGYVMAGYTSSFGNGEEDVLMIRADAQGRQLWTRTYGGSRSEIAHSVLRTSDGGYLIGASSGSHGGGNSDYWVVRTDAEGGELWARSYGTRFRSDLPEASPSPFDWCTALRPTRDGGFVLAGYTNSQDIMNALIIRADGKGDPLWQRVLGKGRFYDYGQDVMEGADGKFVVCGTTKSVEGNNDIYLVGLAPSGDTLWEKDFGGRGSDWGSALAIGANGTIVVTGQTNSGRVGGYDVLLLQLAPAGERGPEAPRSAVP